MNQGSVERRRARRAALEAPMLIRKFGTRTSEPFKEYTAQNISLAGVYFEAEEAPFALNEILMTSMAIPDSQRRVFPFTRLAGPARVVRVDQLPPEEGKRAKGRVGIALELSKDVTALTATPER